MEKHSGALLVLIGWLAWVSFSYGGGKTEAASLERRVSALEGQMAQSAGEQKTFNSKIDVIANDVNWIKQNITRTPLK